MQEIEPFSYQCGVIDCFCEMVKAGLKPLAMSHPEGSKGARDLYLPFVKEITRQYGVHFYAEDEAFLTDLFPISLNRGKFNFLFYRQQTVLEAYLRLKADKSSLVRTGKYAGPARKEIAYRFGRLLGYQEGDIARYLQENTDREA